MGLLKAANDLRRSATIDLAVEIDPAIAAAFSSNLSPRHLRVAPVESVIDGQSGARLTASERTVRREFDDVSILAGGPPCQGFSDLNNRTRHVDARNVLYARMARAAEVMRPRAVLIENVPGVRRDKTGSVVATLDRLAALGYNVDAQVVDLSRLGVPQRRRRYVVVATRSDVRSGKSIVSSAINDWADHPPRTVEWAIGDLLTMTPESDLDIPSSLNVVNQGRAEWLITHDAYELPNPLRPSCQRGEHRYQSMYGRLHWDAPAQTITSGFGSMGQGRHVHSLRPRVITPHEAARLQTIPDWFRFRPGTPRTLLAEMIGNAVPPLFNAAIGRHLLPAVID